MTKIVDRLRIVVVSSLLCLICLPGISGSANYDRIQAFIAKYRLDSLNNVDALGKAVDKAFIQAGKEKDDELRAVSYAYRARQMMLKMDYDSAFVSVNTGLNYIEKSDSPDLRARLLMSRATVQTLRSNIKEGMEDAHLALTIADQNGFHRVKAEALMVISRIDIISYRDSLAEVHILESKRISDKYGYRSESEKAKVMLAKVVSLADVSIDRPNRNAEAMKIAKEAYENAKMQKDTISVIESACIIADIYSSMNRWTNPIIKEYQIQAKKYLDEALADSKLLNSPYYAFQSYRYLARWCRTSKDYQGALKYSQLIISQVGRDNYQALSTTYDQMTAIYAAMGDASNALECHNLYVVNVNKQANYDLQNALQEQETRYNTKRKEIEIGNQRMWLAVLSFILVLCILCIYIVNRYRVLTRHSNHELKVLNDDKDKFFSIISHDLKNPAVEQRNALQLLADQGSQMSKEELALYYGELLKSANIQVDLLYNLLNWARLETGKMQYNACNLDLATSFDQEIELIRTMAEHKGIEFEVCIPESAIVCADINMLRTVIRNLLTNSIKYTPRGGKIYFNITQGQGSYLLCIGDSGVGMTEAQIHSLCEPGLHFSSIGTDGEAGTGLGLVLCREMVEKNGSKLNVKSSPGAGSQFSFALEAVDKK